MDREERRSPVKLDIEAIRARSNKDEAPEVEEAEVRLREAERTLEEARSELAQAQKELDHARDANERLRRELEERERELRAAASDRKALAAIKDSLKNEVLLLGRKLQEVCRRLAEATDGEQMKLLEKELAQIKRQLDQRNTQIFGSQSERRRHSPSGDDDDKKNRRKRRRSGPTPQPKLPIEEVHHTLSDEDCKEGCPSCGSDLEEWKNQVDTSEEITAQRDRYKLIVHVRHKYRCKACKHIVTAPLSEPRFNPGGRYTPEFAANILWDKFRNHLPLNRQATAMRCHGLDVSRQTLSEQALRAFELLYPTLMVLHERILQAVLVHVDETSWRMMKPEETKRWWLWGVSDGEAVVFMLLPTRGQAGARLLLRDYSGFVMADDYTVYDCLEKERSRKGRQVVIDNENNEYELVSPDYTLGTCWVHARRYLFRAERYHPEAGEALDLIDAVFRVDREAQEAAEQRVEADGDLDGQTAATRFEQYLLEERAARREAESRSIIRKLDEWRRRQEPRPGTALAEALNHLNKIWDRLELVLTDPRIPLDNNLIERLIRDPVLGRKNFQGSRSELGAAVVALFYSLLCTCVLMGLDPLAYLTRALRHAVANPGATYLPHDYRRECREAEEKAKAEARAMEAEAESTGAARSEAEAEAEEKRRARSARPPVPAAPAFGSDEHQPAPLA